MDLADSADFFNPCNPLIRDNLRFRQGGNWDCGGEMCNDKRIKGPHVNML